MLAFETCASFGQFRIGAVGLEKVEGFRVHHVDGDVDVQVESVEMHGR
jgi:hypothetical protein